MDGERRTYTDRHTLKKTHGKTQTGVYTQRDTLFESYSLNPCEQVNRCKLIENFKGGILRRPWPLGLRLVHANMDLFISGKISRRVRSPTMISTTPSGY